MEYRYIKKNAVLSFVVIAFSVSGCTDVHVPAMGVGAPDLTAEGQFVDSYYNRVLFERVYRTNMESEKMGRFSKKEWYDTWQRTFREIEKNDENPEYSKQRIIEMRREAGLPIWDFMLK